VHIDTFSSDTDALAAFNDLDPTPDGVVNGGTVTNNVTQSINIYTRVQETLNFSVEGDEAADGATAAGASCDPLTAARDLTLGDANNALGTDQTHEVSSYFRLATNSSNGVNIYYSGRTLESPSDDIDEAGATAVDFSSFGTDEEFGLAISAAGSTLTNVVAGAEYDDADGQDYAFDDASSTTPIVIASAPGIVDCETAEVEYAANIEPDTPAGIYQTKINYISAPSY
jgi:hypothetical protein